MLKYLLTTTIYQYLIYQGDGGPASEPDACGKVGAYYLGKEKKFYWYNELLAVPAMSHFNDSIWGLGEHEPPTPRDTRSLEEYFRDDKGKLNMFVTNGKE